MDHLVSPPETGAGAPFAPAPDGGAGGGFHLTPKQAAKHFDLVKVGTKRTLIILGDVVSQRMHFVQSLNHKVQCTARAGSCLLCPRVGVDKDVGVQHLEHLIPAAVLMGDRRYHQKIVIITDDMWQGRERSRDCEELVGLYELLNDEPARGQAFELKRDSKHRFKWTPVRRSLRALALALPPSFDVLPWNRARFGNPQDPLRPLVRFEPFAIQDLGSAPTGRPQELDIAPSDVRTAEEWKSTEAKLKELKAFASRLAPDTPAPAAPAQPPAAVVEPADMTQPPAPAPAAPAPRPGMRIVTPTKVVTYTVTDRDDRRADELVVTPAATAADAIDAVTDRAGRAAAARNGTAQPAKKGGGK